MEGSVGFDVSLEETSFCVMDAAGKIVAQGKTLSDPRSLFEALREHTLCPERIVLETGTLSGRLAGRVRAALEERPGLKPMIEPLLAGAETLKTRIGRLDEEVMAEAGVSPACWVPMTVGGVGPITAPAYTATIGDPGRFAGSRDVGAYGGLIPRSSDKDP